MGLAYSLAYIKLDGAGVEMEVDSFEYLSTFKAWPKKRDFLFYFTGGPLN